jgi:hypothetical protein
LKREEALVLLKLLSSSKLIDPNWVSIESMAEGTKIKIREMGQLSNIQDFCSINNLKLEKQNDYLLISKQ